VVPRHFGSQEDRLDAEAWQLAIAPHDCTGPVVYTASTHLALNATNALFQESVRGFYKGWYPEVVTAIPKVENGQGSVVSAARPRPAILS